MAIPENAQVAEGEDQAAAAGWVERTAFDYTAMAQAQAGSTWDGNARIYQWSDEYGDVGPAFEELEVELFGSAEDRNKHIGGGLDFSAIESIDVVQEGPERIEYIKAFADAGIHPVMMKNVELSGYQVPTPIQKFTIPAILQGYDVIGVAQTGSGKTAAYLIPILSKLMGKAKKLGAARPNPLTFQEGIDNVIAEPLVVVVVPTRELAVQIFNEARKLCYRSMLRPCVVYGGTPIREQLSLLSRGCDILIGTPGRLKDFIGRPDRLTLRRVKYMVIDEADEMLQQDWEEELRAILSGGEQDEGNVKYGLFSATFPRAARALAKEYLSASHIVIETGREKKNELLLNLLEEMNSVRTIIFVNSRQAADTLDDFLYNMKLPVTSIHSDRTQVEREAAMRAFRSGQAPILVATGVTARGIDVRNVMHVINYDLPSMDHGGIEEYTHRIGRTGRIGHRGVATSFFTDRDEAIASVLTRTLLETNQDIPDFLQSYIPDNYANGIKVKFETESDFDPNDVAGAGDAQGGGWGGDETANPGSGAGGWGASGDSGDAADSGGGWGTGGDVAGGDSGGIWGADAAPTKAW
ncbi:DEAD/DEAH box helicase domain-containing protein [Trichoderma breve]|uniref:RNA helicase n=1 Tax=Trichoderma breve TaxID=2034170 RepID=A0A9W9BJK7_9HYPO|nr:DEAD/DEAH box helicase domain-containing protein [Trichoderma breve]KAJ4861555.1 DEAD/DEAH box helicase domain-containing protein [Trichoderma breve]